MDELLGMLEEAEYDRPMYHLYLKPFVPLSVNGCMNVAYYQHVSFAVAALRQIAQAHSAQQPRIEWALRQAFADGRYIRRMTIEGSYESDGIVVSQLKTR